MKWPLFLFCCGSAFAHMVSLSTGDLRVNGNHARYDLRMPLYEVSHLPDAGSKLLAHIHFSSAGAEAKMLNQSCAPREGNLECVAEYEFPSPPERIDAECTFPSITVPNHVHLLRAEREGKSDQAVFDMSYSKAEIRFRPPGAAELALRAFSSGLTRAVAGIAPLLFLCSVILAARSRRELIAIAGALFAGECLAAVSAPLLHIALAPRFLEAAAALTVAYLALEIVLLPQGNRVMVVAILGLFHGMYFAALLTTVRYGAPAFLTGVLVAQSAVLALGGALLLRTLRFPRAGPAMASLLFAAGLIWFFERLWA